MTEALTFIGFVTAVFFVSHMIRTILNAYTR